VPRRFLAAEWRNLLMLNYVVRPELLEPLVPKGTELDSWQGRTYVSLVGFLFANTRLLGVPVPGHRTFEEVNLRFYVRREAGSEVRRGVTFIRELVPRSAIAAVARLAYNEPYVALPMRRTYGTRGASGVPASVAYEWRAGHEWASVRGSPYGAGAPAVAGSEEEFITEHYWGYTPQRDGGTIEYRVDHPSWLVWPLTAPQVGGDHTQLYGREFAAIVAGTPASAFLADGSAVSVSIPTRIE
jgi:uncharacterized protein